MRMTMTPMKGGSVSVTPLATKSARHAKPVKVVRRVKRELVNTRLDLVGGNERLIRSPVRVRRDRGNQPPLGALHEMQLNGDSVRGRAARDIENVR